jgi:galacturonosyltransferase
MIKKISPNLILTYTIKPNIFVSIVSIFEKIKFIPTVTGLGTSFHKSFFLKFMMKKFYSFCFFRANKVFFQNSSNLEFFKSLHSKIKKKFLIVNGSGVNLGEFKYRNKNFSTFKFVFLGRIMREKGINEFLEVAKYFYHYLNKRLFFEVVGSIEDVNLRFKLNDYQTKGFIKYYDFKKQTSKIFNRNNVLINPSYHEGLSNTTLEAIASGLIVLGSDIPGINSILKHGFNGFLFKTKNIEDLISLVKFVININSKKLSLITKNAREDIEKKFDRKRIIKIYLDHIRYILRT